MVNCTTGVYEAVEDSDGVLVLEFREDHVTRRRRAGTMRRIPWAAITAVEFEEPET